jgi:hypothetical protein
MATQGEKKPAEKKPETKTPADANIPKLDLSDEPVPAKEDKKKLEPTEGIVMGAPAFAERVFSDDEPPVSANPLASRYKRLEKRLGAYLSRLSGLKIHVGLFNDDDLFQRNQDGWRTLSAVEHFTPEPLSKTKAAQLGVRIDVTDFVRVDNKFVCWMRDDDRQFLLGRQRAQREAFANRMRGETGQDKDLKTAKNMAYGMQVEETEEIIQLQKSVKARPRTEAAE